MYNLIKVVGKILSHSLFLALSLSSLSLSLYSISVSGALQNQKCDSLPPSCPRPLFFLPPKSLYFYTLSGLKPITQCVCPDVRNSGQLTQRQVQLGANIFGKKVNEKSGIRGKMYIYG